ncbi:MAG: aquaporin [Ruminococcus sp.]|nr:aquaporin [Ruminococcus sp.]
MNEKTQKYIAEVLGTFILVFFGCGTAMVTGASVVATSLAFGISIIAAAYTFGKISGAHLNPAVSFAMMVDGKMKVDEFVGYVISQVVGAFAATGVLAIIVATGALGKIWDAEKEKMVSAGIGDTAYGANGFGNMNFFGALLVEIILTFVFVLVIINITESKDEGTKKHAPIFIGIALTFVHLLGINLTGTSVNPARSIAPAIFAIDKTNGDSIAQLWVFIVGPMVGAFLAALVNSILLRKKEENN